MNERWVGVGVLALVLAVAAAVLVLLDDARSSGLEALEDSKLSEVAATARSFNQRQVNQLTASGGLAQQGFDFAVRSERDQGILDSFLSLIPDPRTGYFLVDLDKTITSGVLFEDPEAFGSGYDRPGYDELVASATFRQGVGGILPVGEGITTTVPTTAFVFPVLNPLTGELRGTFVFESDIVPTSDFNGEIALLATADTDRWRFIDSLGTVVASSELAEVATSLDDERLVTLPAGVHDVEGDIVVLQDVPASGWRIVFSQDRTEFEEALTGPLQDAGLVVVLLLLLAGAAVVVVLVRRLRAANEEERRLRALSESQEEFISIVSHELRTPVAGVLGFLQTSLDHWGSMTDDERRHTMARATMNARRLQALTRDVLDTESLEAGKLAMAFDEIDLADEVSTGAAAARDAFPDRTIEIDAPSEPVPVRADPDRLQQVLANLIDNAQKFSPVDGPVRVRLEVQGQKAVVSVSDDGPGLDPETADRVFDKFIRGRGGTVTGTGLGLYISRRIIEAHDGRIWAESDPGHGAAFSFEIPMLDHPLAPAREVATPPGVSS